MAFWELKRLILPLQEEFVIPFLCLQTVSYYEATVFHTLNFNKNGKFMQMNFNFYVHLTKRCVFFSIFLVYILDNWENQVCQSWVAEEAISGQSF